MRILYFGYGNHAKKIRKTAIDFLRDKENLFEFAIKKNVSANDSGIPMFSSFSQAINQCGKPDVVFISTPNEVHLEAFKLCLDSQIQYIYVEKPALGVEEYYAHRLKTSPVSLGYLAVGYHFLKNKAFIDLRDIIKAGTYGRVISISISSGHGLAFKDGYRSSWRSMGRLEIANTAASHLISLARYLLDDSDIVECVQNLLSHAGNSASDTYHGHFIFSRGECVTLMSSWACPLIKNCTVVFTDGIWTYDFKKVQIFYPRNSYDQNGLFQSPPLALEEDAPFKGIAPSIRDFLTKARTGKVFPPFFGFSGEISRIVSKA